MEKFPLIPGYAINSYVASDYHLPHKFDLINGTRIVRDHYVGIGNIPIPNACSQFYYGPNDIVVYDPSLTYGLNRINDPNRQEKREEPRFIPNYVIFAQKCLKFKAYFHQDIDNFLNRKSNVRIVFIYYFLEDDTMLVTEPVLDNAGYKQGKLVRRSKIPKNHSACYHWKDLNVGFKIVIYGIIYNLIDCDAFTREFLTSQGIDVNAKEDLPSEYYNYISKSREVTREDLKGMQLIPKDFRITLQKDDTVLSFVAVWNENLYNILYYLVDDTMSVRRIPESKDDNNSMSRVLLGRMKVSKQKNLHLAKYVEAIGSTQPSTDEYKLNIENTVDYYSPEDFKIGETIFILGRRFNLIDCNNATRKYYNEVLGINQPPQIEHEIKQKTFSLNVPSSKTQPYNLPITKRAYPGIAKRDVAIPQHLYLTTKFRYSMKMDAVHPEDENRTFILEYHLSDNTMTITEIETENCGRRGGWFLAPTIVLKPDSKENDEENYYTAEDLYVGAKINVFNHHFIITGVDAFVWRYIQEHVNDFSEQLRNNMSKYFTGIQSTIKESDDNVNQNIPDNPCKELNESKKNEET